MHSAHSTVLNWHTLLRWHLTPSILWTAQLASTCKQYSLFALSGLSCFYLLHRCHVHENNIRLLLAWVLLARNLSTCPDLIFLGPTTPDPRPPALTGTFATRFSSPSRIMPLLSRYSLRQNRGFLGSDSSALPSQDAQVSQCATYQTLAFCQGITHRFPLLRQLQLHRANHNP